ncbi:hypothetical protein V6Z11_A01G061700 [Gossypium hirsutum]
MPLQISQFLLLALFLLKLISPQLPASKAALFHVLVPKLCVGIFIVSKNKHGKVLHLLICMAIRISSSGNLFMFDCLPNLVLLDRHNNPQTNLGTQKMS